MPEDGSSQGPTDADSVLEVERLGEAGNVRGQLLDRRRIAHRARFAMAPKVDGDKAEGIGQLMLAGEEAAMRHQAVEKQQRPPRADIVIGDSIAVRCAMVRQRFPLPGALAPVRTLLPYGRPSAPIYKMIQIKSEA